METQTLVVNADRDAPSRTVDCTGADLSLRLRVTVWGDGPIDVLLVHGFAEGAYVWDEVAPLVGRGDSVAALDLRGHGDSAWHPAAAYGQEEHSEDVEAVLDQLGVQRCVLVGHSMGAAVCLRVAARRPDLVVGLALLDWGPDLDAPGSAQIEKQFLESSRAFGSTAAFVDLLAATRPFARSERLGRIAARALQRIEDRYELKRDPRLIETRRQSAFDNTLLWRELSRISCPVLVMRGAVSAILSPAVARSVCGVVRNSRLIVVPRAGHGVMIDNPDGVVAALREFMLQLPA